MSTVDNVFPSQDELKSLSSEKYQQLARCFNEGYTHMPQNIQEEIRELISSSSGGSQQQSS